MGAVLLVFLTGCFQVARQGDTTPPAPTFTGKPETFEGTYDVGVARTPVKPNNCVSLTTTAATRIVSGNVTATWSATGPDTDHLGLYAYFERRPSNLLETHGPSPLVLPLVIESPFPSDHLFLFVDFLPGASSAATPQAVRLTVSFEYLGGPVDSEGPTACERPSLG